MPFALCQLGLPQVTHAELAAPAAGRRGVELLTPARPRASAGPARTAGELASTPGPRYAWRKSSLVSMSPWQPAVSSIQEAARLLPRGLPAFRPRSGQTVSADPRFPCSAVAVRVGDVTASVPEPHTLALTLRTLGATAIARRRRTNAAGPAAPT